MQPCSLFDEILSKYKKYGQFSYKPFENLDEKCNASDNQAGVYLIFCGIDGCENLLYLGSSGQRSKNGTLKVRQGGMWDRIVNGYHPNKFGEIKRIQRKKAFPKQMIKEGIKEIIIYWWVTMDNENHDFPTDVEKRLRENYKAKYGRLPDWHNQ